MSYRAVVVGGSAGGLEALKVILDGLPTSFRLSLLVVQHLHPRDGGCFAQCLAGMTRLPVLEPSDKERIRPGYVYVAPANYHMLVERTQTIALSITEKVNWSRPSIDVLFESAAIAWKNSLISLVLSGANDDGAQGTRVVRAAGGLTLVQDPQDAQSPFMPQAAIDTGAVNEVLPTKKIAPRLINLALGCKM